MEYTMNSTTASGKIDQIKGQVKQSVGEAVGNEKLANSGAADQVKGAAKEAWGNTKDAANAVNRNVQSKDEIRVDSARDSAEHTGHNIRESVTNAAQHVKESINAHADKVKREHEHA
jgi:uncharacterized protein YjbJ (UPF0337 family)